MRKLRTKASALERVSLFDLRSYLEQTGWRRISTKNDRWTIFHLTRAESDPLELILPAKEQYADVRERIKQTIASLSQIEDRQFEEVCADLVATNADSLLVRLQVSSQSDSIPVADASRHIKAIRNLLLYSGCSEIQARPYFEQPLTASFELLTGFEFCHTYRGSFGFEISNAIAKPATTADFFDTPVRRKMIERIARGVQLLDKAVAKEDPAVLIESYESGLNARMCDALADIGLEGQVMFEIGIDWATSLTPSEDVIAFQDCFIGEAQISLLKYASEQLKVVKPKRESIDGQVVNLHCVVDPKEGHARRTVVVRVDHSQHGTIEVKLSLGSEWYLLAIDAHSKGKKISATGELQRKGNMWSLDSITSVNAPGV